MEISIKDLSFSYNGNNTKVFDKLNLNIGSSKSVAIVGGSGIGKSTLLKLISGLEKNYKGEILVDKKLPKELIINGDIGFMFQEPCLLSHLNVKKNIELPYHFLRLPVDSTHVDKNIDIVGLQNFKYFYPKELSGGMKTRVSLARTFCTKPKLLLLDEPFSNLDIRWKYKLYNELKKLQKINSSTLIIVTHNIQEAVLLADKIFAFDVSGNLKEVCNLNKDNSEDITPDLINIYQSEYLKIQNIILEK